MKSANNPTPPAKTPASPSLYPWGVVTILWFICFFNYADRQAIFSIFPVLEKKYHFTKSELGMIGAAFTWVYAFMAPVAGQVGDRYARKWVILGGLYVWSLITGLTAQCSKVWHFVLVRGSEGLGETFYMPASMALISDYHGPRTRSRAIGLHQTSIYAGTIGGSVLAGWMAERYGWQSPFWALGLAGILLGVIVSRFVREPQRNQAERQEQAGTTGLEKAAVSSGVLPADSRLSPSEGEKPEVVPFTVFLAEFVRTPTAVWLILAFFCAQMVEFVFLTWMPTFLKEKFHLNLAAAGLGGTFFIKFANIGGALLGGFIADRWSQRRAEGRILVQAVAVALGTPFVFLCGYTRNLGLLMVAMSFYGLSRGLYDSNLTAAYYDVIAPSRRGTATGLMNLFGFLGAGLGTIAIGVAVDRGVTMSVAISSATVLYVLVAAILFYIARFTARRDILAHRAIEA